MTKLFSLVFEILKQVAWRLQHSLTCFGANLSIALIVAPKMCVKEPKDVSEILSTIFFVSGLVTLLQSTVGTRSVQWLFLVVPKHSCKKTLM